MSRFKISYVDPEDNRTWKFKIAEFEDTDICSAREWAEDYAYALADKGTYNIEELA